MNRLVPRRRLRAWLAAAGIAAASLAAAQVEAPNLQPLTQDEIDALAPQGAGIDELVQIALRSSTQVQSAALGYQKAIAAIPEIESALRPYAGIQAGLTIFDRKNAIDLGALMNGPSLPLTIAEQANPSLTASAGIRLDIGGQVRAARTQAEHMAAATLLSLDRARSAAAFQARAALTEVRRAQGGKRAARENLDASERRTRDMRLQEAAGNVPRFDVISAERDEADARMALAAAAAQEEIAISRLKQTIGLSPSAVLRLKEEAPIPAESLQGSARLEGEGSIQTGDDLALMTAEALGRRPEILAARAMASAARMGYTLAQASLKPSLFAQASFNSQPNHGAFTLENTGSLMVGFELPLIDGGAAAARRKKVEAEEALAEVAIRQAMLQVEGEVREAYINILQSRARIEASEKAVRQAEEAWRLAQVRAEAGVTQSSVVSPQLELASAQAALTAARIARVNALADHELGLAALRLATGEPVRMEARA